MIVSFYVDEEHAKNAKKGVYAYKSGIESNILSSYPWPDIIQVMNCCRKTWRNIRAT